MVFASRSKRCLRTGSAEYCAGRILMATVRSRRVSLARYTSPIPPAPSGPTISYGPSFVPAVRAIGARDYKPGQYLPKTPGVNGRNDSSEILRNVVLNWSEDLRRLTRAER